MRIMTDTGEKLLNQALKLTPEERAELAAALLTSLDGEPDEGVEIAWAEEIERRARRVRAGDARGAPWEDVLERLRTRRRRA
jgi:putative addiction module component (TIGR02574 family)